jgi:hypothetical protein
MAEPSEQARLIADLTAKGHSIKDIAALTGRTPRYITQARDSVTQTSASGKTTHGKGQNLIPALSALSERGKLSPAQIPERRKTKSGATASVRKGVRQYTTKSGKQQQAARVKRGPKTLKRAISKAGGKRLKWDVKYKKMKTDSDQEKQHAWATGKLPDDWTPEDLEDRINNPQEGDGWAPGDVNGALSALALEQNPHIVGATGAEEFSLFTTEPTQSDED